MKDDTKMRKKTPKMLKIGKYCAIILLDRSIKKLQKMRRVLTDECSFDEKTMDKPTREKEEEKMGKTAIDKCQIEKKVEEFIKEYNIDTNEFIDIVALARKIGFEVFTTNLDSATDGFIAIDEESGDLLDTGKSKIIGINEDLSVEKQRFTIAHELAHYYIEGKGKTFFAHRENKKGKDVRENEMDYFAACLLMYYKKFKEIYGTINSVMTHTEAIAFLANKFRVTKPCIERRINELY